MFPFVWWWKPSVAGHEVIGNHGNQPLPWGVDDAAAHDAGCIASKAHAHGKGLFAAGMAAFKWFIQVVGNPGKVSGILQQGEQGEEDGHGRQHHRYNPCQYAVDTQDKDAVEPIRRAHGHESPGQLVLEPEEGVRQHLGRIVGPGDGQPEHHGQHSNHHRITCETAGQYLIQAPVPFIVFTLIKMYGIPAVSYTHLTLPTT